MGDFKSYLAASILTEDKVVTYRLLSRVLKVHVNAAKEMLFEFHRVQNAKKPGTIHATYLIGGTRRKEAPVPIEVRKDGEDDYMQSSPFVGSSIPLPEGSSAEGSILSITLTREEDLDKLRSEYENISSIHIYSLGPHPLKELQLLSDSTREIQTISKTEDPLESYHKYGIITNPNTKRRTRKSPAFAVTASASVPSRPAAVKAKPNEVQEAPKSSSSSSRKPEPKSQPSSAKDFFGNKGKENAKPKSKLPAESTKMDSTSAPSSKETTPAPSEPTKLKRESSSIFKAFAKTQPKKAKTEETDSSTKEDTPMLEASDDDDEDTWMPAPVSRESKEKDRQSRKETQERLRKMMEDDDDGEEEENAAPPPAPATPAEEAENEEKPEEPKDEDPTVTASNGRRRGRRRVMKKRTVKDEDGYLVTKQEQAWESFSEDEPPPAPKAKAPVSTSTKSKKDAPKKGQGNIMSFFAKK
ncbi:hypothetical protein EYC84_000119 [Monilinia fructicola]|uniref:DNA polymerase delta subunit 3 n=1 Tax=Monilinia fructicola TaxID=38448 RepID=A0A5M9JML3_MONFR|nr:hypothetical protein EYC84_000119 [Monilinia fructicola]